MFDTLETAIAALGADSRRAPLSDVLKRWTCQADPDDASDRVSYRGAADGVELWCDGDGLVTTIYLYAFGRDRFAQWPGRIAEGLGFGSKVDAVLDAFGEPHVRGEPLVDPILGAFGGHVRYDHDAYSMHFEFSPENEGLSLVTLMLPSKVPGR